MKTLQNSAYYSDSVVKLLNCSRTYFFHLARCWHTQNLSSRDQILIYTSSTFYDVTAEDLSNFVFLLVFSASWAFNIDVANPHIYTGEKQDFFGYKVMQYISGKEKG